VQRRRQLLDRAELHLLEQARLTVAEVEETDG
jgi:hypothetical protein